VSYAPTWGNGAPGALSGFFLNAAVVRLACVLLRVKKGTQMGLHNLT
jgi:hypothetical protein